MASNHGVRGSTPLPPSFAFGEIRAPLKLLLFLLLSSIASAKPLYTVDWALDTSITGAGLATVATSYALAGKWIRKRCPCDPAEVNAFDRGAIGNHSQTAETFSDILVVSGLVAPAVLDYALVGWGDEFLVDTLVYAQTLALSAATVTLVKHVVQRPLPRSYAGDPEAVASTEGYRSFYSGHVTMVVTALSAASFTAARRHRETVWPWLVTAGMGTLVGIGRVAAGNHFYSDVLVGMAAGVAIGVGVPWLHTVTGGTVFLLPREEGPQLAWATDF